MYTHTGFGVCDEQLKEEVSTDSVDGGDNMSENLMLGSTVKAGFPSIQLTHWIWWGCESMWMSEGAFGCEIWVKGQSVTRV